VDKLAPVSFEKQIVHHYSLFDSIHPNIHNVYRKCRSKKAPAPHLWTNFLGEHIWLLQKLIWFRGCYSGIVNSESWER
jgi:hypothetical protein